MTPRPILRPRTWSDARSTGRERNWFMCSSPASPFVFEILSKNYPDRRREALQDWSGTLQSMAMEPDAVVETQESGEAVPSRLSSRFNFLRV